MQRKRAFAKEAKVSKPMKGQGGPQGSSPQCCSQNATQIGVSEDRSQVRSATDIEAMNSLPSKGGGG